MQKQVFLYGGVVGTSIETTVGMGSVYVLSLPSFRWHKEQSTPQYGRYLHSCNMIGNRQMVVVGGQVVSKQSAAWLGDTFGAFLKDPWSKGLGVFDLSDMEWKSSYDADAAPYTSPQVVRTYIDQHGTFPTTWSDSTVETWFTEKRVLSIELITWLVAKAVLTEGENPSSSPPNPSKPQSLSGGQIAGAVIGSIAGIALIISGLFYLRRRHQQRKHSTAQHSEINEFRKAELEGKGQDRAEALERGKSHRDARELQGSRGGTELPAPSHPVEAASNARYELYT